MRSRCEPSNFVSCRARSFLACRRQIPGTKLQARDLPHLHRRGPSGCRWLVIVLAWLCCRFANAHPSGRCFQAQHIRLGLGPRIVAARLAHLVDRVSSRFEVNLVRLRLLQRVHLPDVLEGELYVGDAMCRLDGAVDHDFSVPRPGLLALDLRDVA